MEKWKIEYPALIYKEHLFTEGRIIIIDANIPQEVQEQLLSLETTDGTITLLLKTEEMTKDLDILLIKELSAILDKKDTLFVFPGYGAVEVKKLSMAHEGYPKTDVFAKRFWQPGTEPLAKVGKIRPPENISARKIKKIVVLDDVISSGQTLSQLYAKNLQSFQTCRWFGGSWIAQVPRMKQTFSGVIGYEKIIAAIVVEGPQGRRVPVNSVDSFQRYPAIAKSYAERHFRNPEEFLKCISLKTKAE